MAVVVAKALGGAASGVLAGRTHKLFLANALPIQAGALGTRAVRVVTGTLKAALVVLQVLWGNWLPLGLWRLPHERQVGIESINFSVAPRGGQGGERRVGRLLVQIESGGEGKDGAAHNTTQLCRTPSRT